MDTRLSRVEPTRAFEAVVAEIRNAIVTGSLEPGDRLPSQRVLADQLGVSQNTVIQAIRVLTRVGLVTVRPGAKGGAFVKSLDGSELIETLELLLDLDQVSLAEIIEVRTVLEGQNAAWAAERRTETELDRLLEIAHRARELNDEIKSGSKEAWSVLLAQDVVFHRAVADAAHNRAASAVMVGALGALNRQLNRLPLSCAPDAVASIEEITEAIRDGDSEAARHRMAIHIYYFAWEVAEQGKPWPREHPLQFERPVSGDGRASPRSRLESFRDDK